MYRLIAIIVLSLLIILPLPADTIETARQAFQNGRYDEADIALGKLLRADPYHIEVNLLYGQVAVARKKHSHAAFAFERITSRHPDHLTAKLALADVYYQMNQPSQSEALLVEILASNPPPAIASRANELRSKIRQPETPDQS